MYMFNLLSLCFCSNLNVSLVGKMSLSLIGLQNIHENDEVSAIV
jgi:hypothetical protein